MPWYKRGIIVSYENIILDLFCVVSDMIIVFNRFTFENFLS